MTPNCGITTKTFTFMSDITEEVQTKKRGRKPKQEAAQQASNGLWNENGLLSTLQYKFTPSGFVDWRAMIDPKFIVLNRQYAAKRGIDLKMITEDEKAKYLEEWPDEGKLILLAGFRDILRIRGYTRVDYTVKDSPCGKSIVTCSICLKPNYETNFQPVVCSGVASASPANVDAAFKDAIEAIAANRAFCRAVREGLNIYVVAEEEMNPTEEVKIASPIKPLAMLEDACKKKGITFDTVKAYLGGMGHADDSWVSFADLPKTIIFDVLSFIQKS